MRLAASVLRNIGAGLKARPLALRGEDPRLQPVGKTLGGADGRGVKDPSHLFVALAVAFPVAIELALGQGELVGVAVEVLEEVLLALRNLSPLDDVFNLEPVALVLLTFFVDFSHFSSAPRIVSKVTDLLRPAELPPLYWSAPAHPMLGRPGPGG